MATNPYQYQTQYQPPSGPTTPGNGTTPGYQGPTYPRGQSTFYNPPPPHVPGQPAPPITGPVPTDPSGFNGPLPVSQGVQQLIDLINGQVMPVVPGAAYGTMGRAANYGQQAYQQGQQAMQDEYAQQLALAQQMTALYQNRDWQQGYDALMGQQQQQQAAMQPMQHRSQAFHLYGY